MIEWFRRLLFDETAFIGLVRAVLMTGGAIVATDPEAFGALLPGWAGAVLMGSAAFIRSSSAGPRS